MVVGSIPADVIYFHNTLTTILSEVILVDSTMDQVINIINRSIKQLPPEMQLDLLRKYKETGDVKYRNRLVESNYAFLVKICKIYASKNITCYEVFSEGIIGLIEAAEKFDLSKDLKFLSYAVWHVKNRVTLLVNRNSEGIIRYSFKQAKKNSSLAKENKHDEINYISYVRENSGLPENQDWNIFDTLVQNTYSSADDALYLEQVRAELDELTSVLKPRLARILRIKRNVELCTSYKYIASKVGMKESTVKDDFDKVRKLLQKNPIIREYATHYIEE